MGAPLHLHAGLLQIDPRQQVCWDNFVNPESKTFGNAQRSALAAGYEEASAHNITIRAWFIARRKQLALRGDLLSDAEKVLFKTLRYKTDREVEEKGKKITKVNVGLLSVQVEAAKHVTKRLGKDQGWAERVEQTGPNGSSLPSPILNVFIHNGNKPNNADAREDQGLPGGDFSEQDGIDHLISDSPSPE
jgi:hypothetical protein